MPSSITLTVSHLPTSTSFFLSCLQPLGYVFRGRQEHTIGFGPVSPPNTPPDFWITQEIPGVPAGAAHVAFPAASRAQVQDFFLAALKAGGKIHGEPAQRDASGYFSAAVIDFDGNSIEAVYRPSLGDENKENEDVRSMVSHKSGAGSVKAPSVAPPKSVVSAKPGTVISQARSNAPSQVRSVTAPSHITTSTPEPTQPKSKPQGDVLDTLINEARSAANVARNLVNSVRPNLNSSPPSFSAPANSSSNNGAGDAIMGTLLGVAAGAALHYAFSNRSKESHHSDHEDAKSQAPRPSVVGRSMTDPNVARPEYSSAAASVPYYEDAGPRGYRAIEPAPSAYTYNYVQGTGPVEGQRLITMHDNDPALSEYASTIRPTASAPAQAPSMSRRRSIDSGFGAGPRDRELDKERDRDNASLASSKASRHSKKSNAPPTSYRAPTVLTTAETQAPKSKSGSRAGSRSRAGSLSRTLGLNGGNDKPSKSRSQSRHSRRSRRDEFDDDEAKTVLHVTEKITKTTSYHPHSNSGSKAPSRASSRHSRRDNPDKREPHELPLPPSRAATWAGSEAGSFVSARSGLGPRDITSAPRTVIGKLTPRNLKAADEAGLDKKLGTQSVVSKQREVDKLDLPEKEVRPEDSVSQISVGSGRGGKARSKASRR